MIHELDLADVLVLIALRLREIAHPQALPFKDRRREIGPPLALGIILELEDDFARWASSSVPGNAFAAAAMPAAGTPEMSRSGHADWLRATSSGTGINASANFLRIDSMSPHAGRWFNRQERLGEERSMENHRSGLVKRHHGVKKEKPA